LFLLPDYNPAPAPRLPNTDWHEKLSSQPTILLITLSYAATVTHFNHAHNPQSLSLDNWFHLVDPATRLLNPLAHHQSPGTHDPSAQQALTSTHPSLPP
jgi:hypothetical protein